MDVMLVLVSYQGLLLRVVGMDLMVHIYGLKMGYICIYQNNME